MNPRSGWGIDMNLKLACFREILLVQRAIGSLMVHRHCDESQSAAPNRLRLTVRRRANAWRFLRKKKGSRSAGAT
eukprot:4164253-Amphidinium_carterae.1